MKQKGKRNIFIIAALCSIIAVISIPQILKVDMGNYAYSNGCISMIIGIGIFYTIVEALKMSDKQLLWISLIIGLLFSACSVFGTSLYRNGQLVVTNIARWYHVLALTPLFSAIVLIIIKKVSDCSLDNIKPKRSKRKQFFLFWLLIFAAWIPFFLASYPGVFGYDSIHQTKWYIDEIISQHHPILHTYFLGFCVVTLGNILGSYEIGMAIYSILQMLILSMSFSAMYTLYIREKLKPTYQIAILIWYMFFPVNPIMAFSATKDILFSAFFSLNLMHLIILAETPEMVKSKKFIFTFVLTSLLMILFRNQGIYIFLLMIATALVVFKTSRITLMWIMTFCVAISSFVSGPLSQTLGITQGDSLREMMSVPCMQLSRAMLEKEDELTEQEKQLIEEYIPGYYWYSYNAGISDAMKGTLDTQRVRENPKEFLNLWFSVGLKCPGTYLDAFCRLTIGLWYFDMNYRDEQAYHPYWEYWPTGEWNGYGSSEFIQMNQIPVNGLEWLHNWLSELSYKNTYQAYPILSAFFDSALPVWSVIVYIGLCVYKKKKEFVVPIMLLIGLIGTLFLSPVVLMRYIYPLVISIPLLFASAANMRR